MSTAEDLIPDLLASVQIYSVARQGGVLTREQLESLLALTKRRSTSISPRCLAAVIESHLRAIR